MGQEVEMALFTRFGSEIVLVRRAALADVKTFENRRVDKTDKQRTEEGWRAVAKYVDDSKEILVDASFMRADGGWAEVSAAFEALRSAKAAS